MNITIFYKEEDKKGDILATNCEEGMEETFTNVASLVVFFFQVLFCFVSFNFGNFISISQLRSQIITSNMDNSRANIFDWLHNLPP
jgi:hypothetical protein